MFISHVSVEEVKNTMLGMKNYCADWDNIRTAALKSSIHLIAELLTRSIKCCIQGGIYFPLN